MATTYSEVRDAWNAAAQRLKVHPDRLAFASLSAMAARQCLLDARKLPASARPAEFEVAVSILEEIGLTSAATHPAQVLAGIEHKPQRPSET